MLYYTTRGAILQVVFGGKRGENKILPLDKIRQTSFPQICILCDRERQPTPQFSSVCLRSPTGAVPLPPHIRRSEGGPIISLWRSCVIMDYQKEYANLVGQIDRAITILENYAPGDPIEIGRAHV